jgi:hypothetical protein
MSLTHVDPHVSEIVMVWIQSGDLYGIFKFQLVIRSNKAEQLFVVLIKYDKPMYSVGHSS